MKKSPIAVALSAFAMFNSHAYAQALVSDATIETVNITSKRGIQPVRDVLSDTTVIDRRTIASSPALSLIDLLQTEAGLEITQQGGQGKLSGVFLRGTKTAQTLIVIDGVRLENPLSGGANLEFIPLAAIERIEVSRGPSSSFYGSAAIGGVIQIFTRQSTEGAPLGVQSFGSFATGSNSTIKANAGIAGSDQSTRWAIAIVRDQTKGYEATLPNSSSYQLDRDGNRQNALNLSVSHQIAPQFNVGFQGFVTQGRTFYDSSFSAPPDTRLDYKTTSLSAFAKGQINKSWASELRVGKSGIFYDYYDASGLFPFAPKSDTLNIAWTNQMKLGEQPSSGSVFAGAETAKQTVTGQGVSTGGSVYGATARRINSVFAGYENRFEQHSVRLQARNDAVHSEGAALSPRANTGTAAYGYTLNKDWQLRASAGSAFRAPTFDDLYSPFGANPNLKPEKSVGYEIGAQFRQAQQSLKLTAFSQKIRQAIELDSTFIPQNYEAAKVTGATIDASQQLGSVRLRGNVTVQDTEGSYTDFSTFTPVVGRLSRRAKVHGAVSMSWLDAVAMANRKNGLQAAAQWQFQGNRFDTDGARLGGYGVLNLSTRYGFGSWSIFGKVNNLFDKQYQLASGYRATPRHILIGVSYE